MLQPESQKIINAIHDVIAETFPIPAKFRSKLPSDIAELSRLLTNKRGDRSLSYLARPNLLSAYLYYFLPWNLFRLCLLLPALNIKLSANDIVTDFGCGPLTFVSALWIAREDLRKVPLEINCIDRSGQAMEAGRKFFTALCKATDKNFHDQNIPWKINIIKEDIDFRKTHKMSAKKRKPASLVCAVNIFNEVYENIPHNNPEALGKAASNAAFLLHNEAKKDAPILIVEPGVPQSGKFISLLRNELLKLNRLPSSPCTHAEACPFLGGPSKMTRGRNWIDTKKRWCHFAFETTSAPGELRRLSAAAKLPKERIVFSYLLTGESTTNRQRGEKDAYARVISDFFPLPENRYGRYCCSPDGLVLITGKKGPIEDLNPHSLEKYYANGQYDKKSGALISEVK